ncbi:Hypothetical protein KVN_LOCUS42 [uncultured virus]|nr:Hypothetical protein KVN_LOCUS42 [uncultured virus]
MEQLKLFKASLASVLVIFVIGFCIVISILISSTTKCMNYNLQIETKDYSIYVNNNLTHYNETDVSFDKFWLACHSHEIHNNLTKTEIKIILEMINNTNGTKCYYNYLMPCRFVLYNKIPLYIPIILIMLFVFTVFMLVCGKTICKLFFQEEIKESKFVST